MVEVKSGYKDHYPDFWAYGKLIGWVKKAYKESKTHEQNILLIITQFFNKSPLISINQCLCCLPYKVAYPVEVNNAWIHMYVYRLKDLLKIPFQEAFNLSELVR
jgi:hypothetical protein